MMKLTEVIQAADQLSDVDQAGLATHILDQLKGAPSGTDDVELKRREAEIDEGTAEVLFHDELCKAIGR